MSLTTPVELLPELARYQVIQDAPSGLRIRVQMVAGVDEAEVWSRLVRDLSAYLAEQGLPNVTVTRDPVPPHADPRSGKFRHAWSELPAQPAATVDPVT